MTTLWDLATYSRDGQLILAVEVKNKLGTTPAWAAQLRRNILAHGVFPNAPYFLLALPDRFYLWNNSDSTPDLIPPTHVVDARSTLEPYFERAGVFPNQISGQSLELIVAAWLTELLHNEHVELDSSQQWIIESGLRDAVYGGSLAEAVYV